MKGYFHGQYISRDFEFTSIQANRFDMIFYNQLRHVKIWAAICYTLKQGAL